MGNPFVRAAFAALAVATVAAFFVAQQLKSEFPLVLRFAARPANISPNRDGYQDSTRVGFDLTRRAKVSFSVVDSEGREIRRLLDDRTLPGDHHYRFRWNGRNEDGQLVPDGIYRMRVVRRDEGRVINSIKKIRVDTVPPHVRLLSATPGVIAPAVPGQRPRVVIAYAGPRNFAPEFRVFRTDGGPTRVVLRFRGDSHRRAVWNGYVRGHPAADGNYTFTARVRDAAGNVTVAPANVPTATGSAPGTGVTVASLTLRGPIGVMTAGSIAHFAIGPVSRSFTFSLTRVGARRSLRTGRRRGTALRIRVPRRARTGLYLLRISAARKRAAWPLAVSGRPAGRRSPVRRPLVVLPVMTWQGRDPVDDDLNGFADTLDHARRVRLDRPYARGRLPASLHSETESLLRFLDRRRLPYDLTTDVSLARERGPALDRASAVVIAGSERWAPPALERRLRGYVQGGGRLAVFGSDSFRRRVELGSGSLSHASRPARANAFGERTALLRTSSLPLAVTEDRLGLFSGLDRIFGSFSAFELSSGLPVGAQMLAGAGPETGKRALVAYRLGRGIVIRMGTPQWPGELPRSQEVQQVTGRVWRLLRRR